LQVIARLILARQPHLGAAVVTAAGNDRPITSSRHGAYPAQVASQPGLLFASGHIPDADNVVLACRYQGAVAGERDAKNWRDRDARRFAFLPASCVPQLDEASVKGIT